jgi:hypothetical protein
VPKPIAARPLPLQLRTLNVMRDNGLDTDKWHFYFCPRATVTSGSTLADVYFYKSQDGVPTSRTTKWKSINDVVADEKGVRVCHPCCSRARPASWRTCTAAA